AGRHDWQAANTLFADTLDRATQLRLPLEQARIQAAWGQLLLRSSASTQRGQHLLDEARHTFTAHDARAELNTLAI
ncbi:MAG TPA: hypothetical protein VFU32_07165, partial [Ktedonobacterales bacterium]|nr:hypothetical protein [Ktedonobacterales bacterium]